MPVADPIQALRAYLLTQTDVTALVGSGAAARIYGEEVPASVVDSMPTSNTLVLVSAGGRQQWGTSNMDVSGMRVSIRAYGPTHLTAATLDRATYAAMKAIRRWATIGQGGLHYATLEAGPFTMREPLTDWPFVLSTYMLMVGEVIHA